MNFNTHIAASGFPALAELFQTEGRRVVFARGEAFAYQDRRNRLSGLVDRGAFRYVHLAESGERHVVGYAFAGEFVGDYISMSNGLPGWVGIEAMCESAVLCVDYDRLTAFFAEDVAHERLGRRLAEYLLAEVYERLLQCYASTPQECYESLLRRCPGLLDLVSLKELASYLRVRPETLSRIRRRMR